MNQINIKTYITKSYRNIMKRYKEKGVTNENCKLLDYSPKVGGVETFIINMFRSLYQKQ